MRLRFSSKFKKRILGEDEGERNQETEKSFGSRLWIEIEVKRFFRFEIADYWVVCSNREKKKGFLTSIACSWRRREDEGWREGFSDSQRRREGSVVK